MAKQKLQIATSCGALTDHSGPAQDVIRDLGAEVIDANCSAIVPETNSELENILSTDDMIQMGSKLNADEIYKSASVLVGIFEVAVKRSEEYLKDKDGLLILGNNAMVDPRMYGKQKPPDMETDLQRAIAEMALIHVCTQRGIPLLAICGGNQIFNVYHGGTLKPLSSRSLRNQGFFNYDEANLPENSELRMNLLAVDRSSAKSAAPRKVKSERVSVFGAHSEAVDVLGGKGKIVGAFTKKNTTENATIKEDESIKQDLLSVAAFSSDNEIEAITTQYGAPMWGLQFHPEVSIKAIGYNSLLVASEKRDLEFAKRIFVNFIASARTYSNKRNLHQEVLIMANKWVSTEGLSQTNSGLRRLHVGQKTSLSKEGEVRSPVRLTPSQIQESFIRNPITPSQIKDDHSSYYIIRMIVNFFRSLEVYFKLRKQLRQVRLKEKNNMLLREPRVGGKFHPIRLREEMRNMKGGNGKIGKL